jgi:hypothetical protein
MKNTSNKQNRFGSFKDEFDSKSESSVHNSGDEAEHVINMPANNRVVSQLSNTSNNHPSVDSSVASHNRPSIESPGESESDVESAAESSDDEDKHVNKPLANNREIQQSPKAPTSALQLSSPVSINGYSRSISSSDHAKMQALFEARRVGNIRLQNAASNNTSSILANRKTAIKPKPMPIVEQKSALIIYENEDSTWREWSTKPAAKFCLGLSVSHICISAANYSNDYALTRLPLLAQGAVVGIGPYFCAEVAIPLTRKIFMDEKGVINNSNHLRPILWKDIGLGMFYTGVACGLDVVVDAMFGDYLAPYVVGMSAGAQQLTRETVKGAVAYFGTKILCNGLGFFASRCHQSELNSYQTSKYQSVTNGGVGGGRGGSIVDGDDVVEAALNLPSIRPVHI